jgi:hypothetical protein
MLSQNRVEQHSKILGIRINKLVHEIKSLCVDAAVLCLDLILKDPSIKFRSLFYLSRRGKRIKISHLSSL